MDGRGVGQNDLQTLCTQLAKDFPFAARINSMSRQVAADRAWQAIARFYKHCQEHKPGKKGYPRFQHDNRSVEYVRQFTCDHIAWEQALNLGGN